jgi:hypothetical protein
VADTACAAFLAMKFFKVPFTAVLAACALLGLATSFIAP